MNIKQIFRSLLRDRLNTAIILISLAIGMACINLILLFIYREVDTDSFQKNANRIYLLNCDNPFEKGAKMSQCRLGGVEYMACLLYTSDAADEEDSVDLGGRR